MHKGDDIPTPSAGLVPVHLPAASATSCCCGAWLDLGHGYRAKKMLHIENTAFIEDFEYIFIPKVCPCPANAKLCQTKRTSTDLKFSFTHFQLVSKS